MQCSGGLVAGVYDHLEVEKKLMVRLCIRQSVFELIPKAGHSRRPSLFGWDCSFPLVDIGL